MNDDLDALENWAAPLLERMQPAERRKLGRDIARELRKRQAGRIKAQQNPDGKPFAPRKPQARAQAGAIRRGAMFTKIRQAKYLKASGQGDAARIGFFGRVSRIARVHQEGLRAKVDRNGPWYDYPERRLLGYSDADRAVVRDMILDRLGSAT
ncbi:phage virion morphogenesis protein [Halomonas urumqiensis]|uniref:Phage virion morphogenesis protein n=1 Tax=Halomonas urumqiensis TaxID=1684789 RepID=A0A2N7UDK0_9GAMM|nr:phage virion morphogenesis protein [Halomonas urumqiensis]PMR78532.1 phage virion morphogenesis protein [Halomonas urumqiensis]PTB03677.1 phage virion morphogenesis protein [Halomonas urumqiensis]GHE20110.1 virion morphogenesis protein [Halomonas urumqiensis]